MTQRRCFLRIANCRHFLLLCYCLLPYGFAHAWNATGHREVAAVAWVYMDQTTREHVATLFDSQTTIPDATGLHDAATLMAAATWPDNLRDSAENSRAVQPPPNTLRQWLVQARSGEATHRWHFSDRDIAKPFEGQHPQGLLEQALTAQLRLLADPTLSKADRAVALAWVSHLVADAHQPLHCASRAEPDQRGELDAGGNRVTVIDAGRKPPDPLSLHRWWDELPGHARPGSERFDKEVAHLSRLAEPIPESQLVEPPLAWIHESFDLARDQVYPGLVPDDALPSTYTIRQDYWLASRNITRARLALAGRRLAYVVTQALQNLK